MKKRASIFLILFLLSLSVAVLFVFNSYKKSEIEVLTQDLSLSHLKAKDSTIEALKNEFILKKDDKVARALLFVKKNSRKPTAQLHLLPQNLISTEVILPPHWKIWLTARSIQADQTVQGDLIVAKVGGYNIIETGTAGSVLTSFDKSSPTVVYDSRLQKPGIVTGLIKLKTLQKNLLQSDLIALHASIINSFDDIQTYYVTSDQNHFDLESLFFFLKSKPYLEEIELDILDRDYERK